MKIVKVGEWVKQKTPLSSFWHKCFPLKREAKGEVPHWHRGPPPLNPTFFRPQFSPPPNENIFSLTLLISSYCFLWHSLISTYSKLQFHILRYGMHSSFQFFFILSLSQFCDFFNVPFIVESIYYYNSFSCIYYYNSFSFDSRMLRNRKFPSLFCLESSWISLLKNINCIIYQLLILWTFRLKWIMKLYVIYTIYMSLQLL